MSEDLQVVEGGEDEIWMDWIKLGEDGHDLYWGVTSNQAMSED